MNGKKAKRLRRMVREGLGIEYPIQRANQYQQSNVVQVPYTLPNGDEGHVVLKSTWRVHPAEPRAVYQKLKVLVPKGYTV